MHTTLTTLIDRLEGTTLSRAKVIRWGCPVPSFGDLSRSRVATLGLNPSNREFVDADGNELDGASRRFHTLKSLGLSSWIEVDSRHLQLIIESCHDYFHRNPYDMWFRKLDRVISGTSASYYGAGLGACHLDLIPYATDRKWTDLTPSERARLLAATGDTLGLLLRSSPVRILILNGRSVVDHFQVAADVSLEAREMPSWSLPRKRGSDVTGMAYRGVVDEISGIQLGHRLLVLGFNHNLQSSFGVTRSFMSALQGWITRNVRSYGETT